MIVTHFIACNLILSHLTSELNMYTDGFLQLLGHELLSLVRWKPPMEKHVSMKKTPIRELNSYDP